MKVIAFLLCGVALVACNPAGHQQWEDYKKAFGKSYASQAEDRYRKSIYDQNQKFVDEHNLRFEQGLVTFDLEMNQFADMTTEEFTSKMNGFNMEAERSRSRNNLFTYESLQPVGDSVDWRDKGAVTPVKNQADCGSCWAFSTTGSLEGQHFLKDNKLVSLSEQNLVDCSQDFGNMGCHGGLMDNAFKYIKSNNGIDTEESYPYEAQDGKCRFNAANVGATVTGFVDIAEGDEKALQQAVSSIGPISVAIDASRTSFSLYKSGVYYEEDCSSTALDHGVLAVGYGNDKQGGDYWLVKNSWGGDWGDEGYIKMARNKDNNCGIATIASYPLV